MINIMFFFFLDTWTEDVDSGNLRGLLESFKIVIPDNSQHSFARTLLEGPFLTDFVQEIRSLARRVVLCKNFEKNNRKPGTVVIHEVIVKNKDNGVAISHKVIKNYKTNVFYTINMICE